MQDNTAEFRSMLDAIAQQVVDCAQEMIRQGIHVNAAFKMAISWELEIQMKAAIIAGTQAANTSSMFMRDALRAILVALRADDRDELARICETITVYLEK